MMNAVRLLCTFAVCNVACAACACEKDDADSREKLETAIPEAIKLLEKGEFETFLQQFSPPDDLKKQTANAPLSEIAKSFGKRKAPRLLGTLRVLGGREPTFSEDGTVAVYRLKRPLDGKMDFNFIKIENLWYINSGVYSPMPNVPAQR